MLGIILAVSLPLVIYVVVQVGEKTAARSKLLMLFIGGYALRLVLQLFVRDLPLFSHVSGGDCELYEAYATLIAQYWQHSGVSFLTDDQMPGIGAASLPPNLFALVIYLNDGPTRVGCTALVAVMACITCFNIYRMAIELGCDQRVSFRITAALLFSPAFLLYTSDMFKDGLVLFFVIGALGSAFRLSRKFSMLHVAIGIVCLWALWHVRFYLIFVTIAPMLVGFTGFGSKSATRPVLIGAAVGIALTALLAYTSALQDFSATAGSTFEHGTGQASLESNATGGSGVTFNDGGSPFGALWLKVLYTLFSPFPWQAGSFGLQVGKIEVAAWYYIVYRVWIAAQRLWQENRSRLLMFLTFILPTTIMYATIMTNVGLIVRERMPIFFVGTLLATQSWARRKSAVPETEATGATVQPGSQAEA